MYLDNTKSVLITGTRNTGFETARLLAASGWNIHLASRKLADAQRAAAQLRAEFPQIQAYGYEYQQADPGSIRQLFAAIRNNTDSLQGFVANAANLGVGLDIYNTTPELYDAVMDVNVKGTFFCCQEAGKLMTRHGGSIVLLSSVQAKGAVEGRSVYTVSKAAVAAMAKTLAYDLAPYGIRVNCLVAGAIHTDRWDACDPQALADRRANYPLGKEADMEDIANGILYFLSDASKSCTGTELTVDAGVLVPILPYSSRKQFKREDYQ